MIKNKNTIKHILLNIVLIVLFAVGYNVFVATTYSMSDVNNQLLSVRQQISQLNGDISSATQNKNASNYDFFKAYKYINLLLDNNPSLVDKDAYSATYNAKSNVLNVLLLISKFVNTQKNKEVAIYINELQILNQSAALSFTIYGDHNDK